MTPMAHHGRRMIRTVAAFLAAASGLTLSASADVASTRYVRKGLVGQYDGIDNAGVGLHVSDTNRWADLSGNGNHGKVDTANIAWAEKGWTYSCASTKNNVKPVTLTSAIGQVINSCRYTLECAVKPQYISGKTPSDRCGLFGNYCNTDAARKGVSIEMTADKELRYYLYMGAPDATSAVVVNSNENATVGVQTTTGNDPVFWKNGTGSKPAKTATSSQRATSSEAPIIGGEVNTGRDMTFRGTYYACRVYNRILSDAEMKINAAIDQVRFFGKTVAEMNESVMPTGWVLTEDGQLRLTSSVTDFVWSPTEGVETEADSLELTAPAATLKFEGIVQSEVFKTFEESLAIDGQLCVSVPTELASGDYTLVSAQSIELGAGAGVTLAPDCVTGNDGNTRTLEVTDTEIVLHVKQSGEVVSLGSDKYVKYGLLVHYDGIDNLAVGSHDETAGVWKDLSGNGHDLELANQGSWVVNGRENTKDGRLGWIDRVYADMAATMNYTVDIVAKPSAVSARFCYIGNYNLVNANSVCFENAAGGGFRWFSAGSPDWKPAVYAKANETAVFSFTVGSDRYRLFKDGEQEAEVVGTANSTSTDGRRSALGGDNARGNMAFKGTYNALRLYDRPLSKEEVAVNAAVDRVRFVGGALRLPKGWTLQDDGRYLRTYEGSETIEPMSVVDGDVKIVSGATLTLTPMSAVRKQLFVTGRLSVEGPVTLALPDAQSLITGDYVLFEANALECAEGASFVLDANTTWASGSEFGLIKSDRGLTLRVFSATLSPSWMAGGNRNLRYWRPDADNVWSTANNWTIGTYDGERGALPGYDADQNKMVYCCFTRPGVVSFTQLDKWTHPKTYLSVQSGLAAPVVFEATDPAYGLDMRVQTTSAFALSRGENSSGWLKVRSGTYSCTGLYVPATENESPRSRTRLDVEGGKILVGTNFHVGWSDEAYAETVFSGGEVSVSGCFYANQSRRSVTKFTLENDATLSMTKDFQLSDGTLSTFVGRQTGGLLNVGGIVNFKGSQPAESSYTLIGGKVAATDIKRSSSVSKFILAGGSLAPAKSTDSWLPNADFLTVANGAVARIDTDGKDVTLQAKITDAAGGTDFSLTKEGEGTLTLGANVLKTVDGTLAVEGGALSLQNGAVDAHAFGTLKLTGGVRLVFDVTADGADVLNLGEMVFDDSVTSLNPIEVRVVYNGLDRLPDRDSRTLVSAGVKESDLTKLKLVESAGVLTVKDGALVLKRRTGIVIVFH